MTHKLIVRAAELALDLQDLAATPDLPCADATLLESFAAAVQSAVDCRLNPAGQATADASAELTTQRADQVRSL